MEDLQPLYESIKQHEGYRARPYADPIHGWKVPTVGYGSTRIGKKAAEIQMQEDVSQCLSSLSKRVPFFIFLPLDVRFVLIEMAYQMGAGGVLSFKNMWAALKKRDYEQAAIEMLNSRWAEQTPIRARDLAQRMERADG